jgi:ribosomal protein L11
MYKNLVISKGFLKRKKKKIGNLFLQKIIEFATQKKSKMLPKKKG